MIGRWWRRRRKRAHCFHHDHRGGDSWLNSRLIETGMAKMFWCRNCGRTWFT